jgi:hypothetical protein
MHVVVHAGSHPQYPHQCQCQHQQAPGGTAKTGPSPAPAAPAQLPGGAAGPDAPPRAAANTAAAAPAAAPRPPPEREPEPAECGICYRSDVPLTAVLMGCGHGGFCRRCAHLLAVQPSQQCPMCRAPISGVVVLQDAGAPVGELARVAARP